MSSTTTDITNIVDKLNIRRSSIVHAVNDVADRVRNATNPCSEASYLFKLFVDKNIKFDDAVFARTATKSLMKEAYSANFIIDDAQLFVDEAMEYAGKFCADPQWSFLWSQPDSDNAIKPIVETVQVVDNIDIKVAVKADGKIKKGGKQLLAVEMYKQSVVDAEVPLSNQEFIALIMEKLDMSKAGATTYAYNCKNHFKAA